jgi:metal-responsive CopG/Arc/MetJ family transcriptional regulator
MGKTISITIPKPLEEELKEASTKQGVSRSRFICNILMAWSEKVKKEQTEEGKI